MTAFLPRPVTLACLVGMLGVPVACADDASPPKNDTVHGFAKSAPDCLAWSDGCVVCARDENRAPHCSTPGIACVPAAVACKVSRSQP